MSLVLVLDVQVLQKPSLDEMRQKGAVLNNKGENRIEGSATSLDEFIYTDSAFYFDHAFASRLVSFYEDVMPLGRYPFTRFK